jgi:hypothetical protein
VVLSRRAADHGNGTTIAGVEVPMRLALVALCFVASLALAQKTEPPKPLVQVVDFGETKIGGERSVPIGELYAVPPRAKFHRLIQVRMNFNDKLRESVHEM